MGHNKTFYRKKFTQTRLFFLLHSVIAENVYAPILDAEDSVKDKFYEELTNTIREEQEYYTIVMGDFNAKIGGGNSNTERNM